LAQGGGPPAIVPDRQLHFAGNFEFIRLNPTESECSIFFKANLNIFDMRSTIYERTVRVMVAGNQSVTVRAKAGVLANGHQRPHAKHFATARRFANCAERLECARLTAAFGRDRESKYPCKFDRIKVNQGKSNHFFYGPRIGPASIGSAVSVAKNMNLRNKAKFKMRQSPDFNDVKW
jgi:hypothetical protein